MKKYFWVTLITIAVFWSLNSTQTFAAAKETIDVLTKINEPYMGQSKNGWTTERFSYDKNGLLSEVKVSNPMNSYNISISYNKNGKIESCTRVGYNTNGMETETDYYQGVFDSHGRLVEIKRSSTIGSNYWFYVFSYDNKGHIRQMNTRGADGTVIPYEKYKYNKDGYVKRVYVFSDGKWIWLRDYSYNEHGDIEQIMDDDDIMSYKKITVSKKWYSNVIEQQHYMRNKFNWASLEYLMVGLIL